MAAGARAVGRKIGLTSAAVQAQLGVDRPDFGVLLEDMQVAEGTPVSMDRLLQPKVEAEIVFVLGADLDGEVSLATVRAAVDHAVVALEIVDSRIDGWDISFSDTVADNASSGLFVLGARRLTLAEFESLDTRVTLYVDGLAASTGTGTAFLGDPLRALTWLAATARDLGDPLRAGQLVLPGRSDPWCRSGPGLRSGPNCATATAGRSAPSPQTSQENKHEKHEGRRDRLGNIGTDLMIKVLRLSDTLEMAAMVGIDPNSDGLARARSLGVPTTHAGVHGLIAIPVFDEIDIVFDATSAAAHRANASRLR